MIFDSHVRRRDARRRMIGPDAARFNALVKRRAASLYDVLDAGRPVAAPEAVLDALISRETPRFIEVARTG
jgi:hypothetical protein